MKVAIVGRRNTGKSTFINTLAQAERMIVSEIPGTTRDSVDVRFELDGKTFMAIDTPGVRGATRASRPTSTSTARTGPSAASAGPTWCCCSSTARSGISKVDKQLCEYIAEQYKPCIFVVNKWDLLLRPDADGAVGRLICGTLSARCGTCRSRSSPARRARTSRPCSTTPRCCSSRRCERVTTGELNRLVRGRHEKDTRRRMYRHRSAPRSTTPRRSASSRRRSC